MRMNDNMLNTSVPDCPGYNRIENQIARIDVNDGIRFSLQEPSDL